MKIYDNTDEPKVNGGISDIEPEVFSEMKIEEMTDDD